MSNMEIGLSGYSNAMTPFIGGRTPKNSIFNDEEAMDLIRLLQDKGYEADEVYNEMKEMSS